jgi:hypothetical protein
MWRAIQQLYTLQYVGSSTAAVHPAVCGEQYSSCTRCSINHKVPQYKFLSILLISSSFAQDLPGNLFWNILSAGPFLHDPKYQIAAFIEDKHVLLLHGLPSAAHNGGP